GATVPVANWRLAALPTSFAAGTAAPAGAVVAPGGTVDDASVLAAGTEEGRALAGDFAADRGAGGRAGLARAVGNGKADAKVAGAALGGDEVAKRGPPLLDGLAQNIAHGPGE